MTAPLEGLRIVELASGVAGPFAGKLLSDYGADVVKVEPPGGDESRRAGPFPGGVANDEASGRFLFLNTGKRSVILDLDEDADRRTLLALIEHADAVIESFAPGYLASIGLDHGRLDERRPGVVLVSVTPWGQDGPYVEADYQQTDLVAQAMGGPMLWTGSSDREPLRLGGGGSVAHYQAGAITALAALVALHRAAETGDGDHVDVSIFETQIGSRDRAGPYLTNFFYNGTEPLRRASGGTFASGMRPTRDGWVNILGSGTRRLPDWLRMFGLTDLADDPDIFARTRDDQELASVIDAQYMAWLSEQEKLPVATLAQEYRLLAGPVNQIADLVEDPHFRGRGLWETVDHPVAGSFEYPGRPFIPEGSPRGPLKRAPLLDEHRDEILSEVHAPSGAGDRPGRRAASDHDRVPAPGDVREPTLALGTEKPAAGRSSGGRGDTATRPRLPLEGVRVADITVVWAGPYATQLLAEWGAEVIRVEPTSRPQPSSRGAERPTSVALEAEKAAMRFVVGGSYPDLDPGDQPWNRNSGFNSHARNKLSMSCDIMDPEGRELFLRFIEHCDLLIENNVPTTIERAGITYEDLRKVNPRLIMVRMPAYGLSGPYSGWRALGTHVEGLIGHHHVRGYPGASPDTGGDVFTADAAAGAMGALASIMALRHRHRTGEGQQIELPLAEGFVSYLGELVLDYHMNGSDVQWGNRHRSHAPHQAFPTRGEDEWIAIEARTDEEFGAICEVLDCPTLASDPRFVTADERKRHEDELERLLAERTRGCDRWELFDRLQAAGVPAGPLQTAAERATNPQLLARGLFEELETPATGPHRYIGPLWRMSTVPNALRRGPVMLGQDNEYVYREVMGLSAEEFSDLASRGLIGDTYPPAITEPWERLRG